jgi:protein involved in polysaccharide export with SLBB domain
VGGPAIGTSAGGGAATGVPTIDNSGQLDSAAPPPANQDARTDSSSGIVRAPLVANEFQRFVFSATGQQLPIFGQRYFDEAERTPVDRVPVPVDYVLGPGDELYIRAWGSLDMDYRATIDRNGQINIPRVGSIGIAGLKAGEVEGHLRSQVGRIFRNFSLNVTLGQLRSVQVFVVGQARRPGSYTVSSLSNLISVILSTGGPGANGSMRHVQLKRDGQVVSELDIYDFLVRGSKGNNARLQPGDVIVFNPAGPRVALMGALDTPAIYELKAGGESIADVLAYGGGTNASTNPNNAQLERIDNSNPAAPRVVSMVELAGAVDRARLRDGDILTLFGVAPRFSNAVTLRGNVAAPLRYPFTPGMRISELIPDREALITPDYYVRKNKLVQFTNGSDVSAAKLERDVRNLLDEPNWEYAAIERLNTDRVAMELIPFNLGKAVIDRDPAHDLVLQPGDVITIFGRADIRNPVSSQTRLVRVQGEVRAPGIYQIRAGETLPQLIERVGGVTPEAYLFGTEFAREETRRQQQLALDEAVNRLETQLASEAAGNAASLAATDSQSAAALRLAQGEAAKAQLRKLKAMRASGRISLELPTTAFGTSDLPGLQLEDGDRVTIPAKPAFVFAVGAVANNNALLWKPGRKASNYLDIAGVDADADFDNLFIVRADGTVLHSSRRGWFSNIEKVELMPGDTVVVPGKTNRETFWASFTRGLKDWSQIFYQFGLSAAAIQTLRN